MRTHHEFRRPQASKDAACCAFDTPRGDKNYAAFLTSLMSLNTTPGARSAV